MEWLPFTKHIFIYKYTSGDGLFLSCGKTDSYPANNGGVSGSIACVCDGKNPCSWQSADFRNEISEDEICISDHSCPVSLVYIYTQYICLSSLRFEFMAAI